MKDYTAQETALKAILNQKRISILGDSLATFDGYSNNAAYNTTIGSNQAHYPKNSILKDVDATYWKKSIDRFHMRLVVNNAFGGAQVAAVTTGKIYTSAPAYQLAEQLWSDVTGPEAMNPYGTKPEIVIIHMGTNDVLMNAPLGSISDVDLNHYKVNKAGQFTHDSAVKGMADAYAYTIAKINYLYNTPQVFCMTVLPQGRNCEAAAEVNSIIRQVAALFDNVTVVDLEANTPWTDKTCVLYTQGDSVHPNGKGMAYIEEALRMAYADAFLGETSDAAYKTFFDNYDYYWLKHTFDKGVTENARYLLVGHSLARFGIDDRYIPGLINLAFLSQDYYYAYKIIEKAIESIPALEHVVIGTTYYSPYMDLSRTLNVAELERIVRVYGRYFHDIHNMDAQTYTDLKEGIFFKKNTEGRSTIQEDDVQHMYEARCGDYFFGEYNRRVVSGSDWSNLLSENDRYRAAKCRTDFHNRMPAYKDSYKENCAVLQKLADLCHNAGVKLSMVVFPANCYYRHYLNPRLREDYMKQIENISDECRPMLWDLYDSAEFDSVNDYVDMDHLNDRGALKMTAMMNDYLNRI